MNKTHPWLRGSIIESKGTWDNQLHSGEDPAKRPYAICATDYASIPDTISGVAEAWEGNDPIPEGDRLVIAAVGNAAQLVVTFDQDLKSGQDLVGKRMAGWTRGSGAYTTLDLMFEEWGFKYEDLKSYDGMDTKAKNDALRDGLVDAIHLSEPFIPDKPDVKSANLAELESNPKPLSYIPVTEEEAAPIAAEYKARGQFFMPLKEIPAGHFIETWPAGHTNFVVFVFWVYKEMPEEIQYEIAKTLVEESEMIAAHGAQASLLVPSVLVGALPVEKESDVAPGALRYYQEAGLLDKYMPDFYK